jgi:hypothetical protein
MTLLEWVEDNIRPEIVKILKNDNHILSRLNNRTIEYDIYSKSENIFADIIMQNIHWGSTQLGKEYFNKLYNEIHKDPEKFQKKDLKTRIKEFKI